MKKFFILAAALFITSFASAQATKAKTDAKVEVKAKTNVKKDAKVEVKAETKPSPAATATGKVGDKTITIAYSQPAVKGREVFGKLVPFNEVWRTGANDATTFTTDKDITVEGKALKAGTYSLFTIPTEKGEWTIIFNSEAKQWGAYKYDAKKDVLRVNVKSSKTATVTERMTFDIKDGNVNLMWEKLAVAFKEK